MSFLFYQSFLGLAMACFYIAIFIGNMINHGIVLGFSSDFGREFHLKIVDWALSKGASKFMHFLQPQMQE